MKTNEEFLNNARVEIKIDLIKWLLNVFDTYEGDYYFPWNNIDSWIRIYEEENNSEYIKTKIKKIQNKLIESRGDIKSIFEEEFLIKIN